MGYIWSGREPASVSTAASGPVRQASDVTPQTLRMAARLGTTRGKRRDRGTGPVAAGWSCQRLVLLPGPSRPWAFAKIRPLDRDLISQFHDEALEMPEVIAVFVLAGVTTSSCMSPSATWHTCTASWSTSSAAGGRFRSSAAPWSSRTAANELWKTSTTSHEVGESGRRERVPRGRRRIILGERDPMTCQHRVMANVWSSVTIDCLDPERVARFWSVLLGRQPGPSQEGWVYLGERGDSQPRLVFQPVSEPATGKVRIHLDVTVDDIDSAMAEVIRLGKSRRSVK